MYKIGRLNGTILRRTLQCGTPLSSKVCNLIPLVQKSNFHERIFSKGEYTHFHKSSDPKNTVRTVLIVIGVGYILLYFYFLEEVPITGRKRLMLVRANTDIFIGEDAYKSLLRQYPCLPANHPLVIETCQIAEQIVKGNPTLCKKDYLKWEMSIVQNNAVNACCLPGGKLCVFTGLFKVMNSNEIAAVLSHEIAHAVARHSSERVSFQQFVFIPFNIILSVAFGIPDMATYIVWKLFSELPYSRKIELEADRIGLYLMANAGFNPKHAIPMYNKLKEANPIGEKLGILSTHPGSDRRIKQLEVYLPDAIEKYEQVKLESNNKQTTRRKDLQ